MTSQMTGVIRTNMKTTSKSSSSRSRRMGRRPRRTVGSPRARRPGRPDLRNYPRSPVQFPILDAGRQVGGRAEAGPLLLLIHLEVAVAPDHLAVALERQDVRGDAVQEPAVVRD